MRFFVPFLISIILSVFLLGCSGSSRDPIVTPTPGTASESLDSLARSTTGTSTTQNPYWSDIVYFEGEYWLAHRNENGTIDRAFGKGIKTNDSPKEIIDSHPEIFKVPFSSLVKIEEYTKDRIHYVFFRQVINGYRLKIRWSNSDGVGEEA